ncbi:hypothetical protein Nepgr_017743 [Nepenthes gracilis]|uniref:Transmembrane protein n=1 Tax=Nepenthes gracilis TaxID=150966 RepID=A0AAD3SSV8_NEPGR|nr:hypothetical protein Nepgr_017743 [Nepenthes gracilis]
MCENEKNHIKFKKLDHPAHKQGVEDGYFLASTTLFCAGWYIVLGNSFEGDILSPFRRKKREFTLWSSRVVITDEDSLESPLADSPVVIPMISPAHSDSWEKEIDTAFSGHKTEERVSKRLLLSISLVLVFLSASIIVLPLSAVAPA